MKTSIHAASVASVCFLVSFVPAAPPTSAPATQPDIGPVVASLVADLRSGQFARREQTQKRLAALGESAVPFLLSYITEQDDEVSARIAEIVGKPRDPALRVAVAVKLLATTDPDWMERAVHMLYEDPAAVCDLFLEKTRADQGALRVVSASVADSLRDSKRRWDMFSKRYEQLRRTKPDAAANELKSQKDQNIYEAEAAYWTAYEALADFQAERAETGKPKLSTSGPAHRGPPLRRP